MAPALPDDLSKLTVAKLKDALKKRGLDVAGLKADLVARLRTAVDAENDEGPRSPKSPPTKSPRQSKGSAEGQEVSARPRASRRPSASPRARREEGREAQARFRALGARAEPCPPNRRRGKARKEGLGTAPGPPRRHPRRNPSPPRPRAEAGAGPAAPKPRRRRPGAASRVFRTALRRGRRSRRRPPPPGARGDVRGAAATAHSPRSSRTNPTRTRTTPWTPRLAAGEGAGG